MEEFNTTLASSEVSDTKFGDLEAPWLSDRLFRSLTGCALRPARVLPPRAARCLHDPLLRDAAGELPGGAGAGLPAA